MFLGFTTKILFWSFFLCERPWIPLSSSEALQRNTRNRNLLYSTQVHNADDDGRLDEEQYEEINHLSQESLERGRNVVLPTWKKTKKTRAQIYPYYLGVLAMFCFVVVCKISVG